MQVRVLGAVEVIDDDGRASVVSSPSQRIVLAVLAAKAGQVVRADELADALWGDAPPPSATTSLRTYVSRLRRLLGDELVIHPTGYELRAVVDAATFAVLVTDADATNGPKALDLLDRAEAGWRGDPFAGLDDIRVLDGPRARLIELRRTARTRRARALLDAGRAADAAIAAELVVDEDPWREGAWVVLIEALAADARPADALRSYQRAAATLAEAGLEPGDALRRAEASVLVAERRPTASSSLPVPTTSLIGRADDLAAVAEQLRDARLVTLLGPGGVGKTRLALESARSLADRFEWGARLVALEAVEDPADVAAAVADGLGLDGAGAPMAERLAAAGDLDLLVVLDNCEHVIDAAAEVVGALCAGGTRIRVVATSRERLGVGGEHVWSVRPLAAASGGRDLLLARARATRPDVDLGDVDLIDRVLARLDGLPLAIEMAASQLSTASLEELERALDDGLGALAAPRRDAPARHRSVADLVRWTTERIDEIDRSVLAELSVFAGPIDVEAAVAVTRRPGAGAVLRRLAERSLLAVAATGPDTSFTMIGPIRACAADLLAADGRTDVLAAAHAARVIALAQDADRELRTEREAEALARLDRAIPDLRAAHRWTLARDRPSAFALHAALLLYGQTQVRLETLGWATELVLAAAPDVGDRAGHVRAGIDDALAAGADPDDVAATLAAAAHAAVLEGDLGLGRLLSSAGTSVPGTDRGWWAALEVCADIALFEGRLDEAVALLEPIDRMPDEPHRAMLTLLGRTLPTAYGGDQDAAEALLDQLLRVGARSPSDRAWVAYAEGDVILDRDAPRALAAFERAVALADEVNDRYVGGIARISLCSLLARVGDADVAAHRFIEVIDHWRRRGATTHLLTTLRNLPVLLERLGRPHAAAELIATLENIEDAPTWGDEADRLAAVAERVDGVLDAATRAEARAVGADRTLDAAARAASAVLTEAVGPP